MKYRQISSTFWEDGYTLKLNDKEKLFFLYLFTNSKVSMIGIYELPDVLILPTLGCTLEELEKMKAKFENDRKYFFYDGWVYINNFVKYNRYSTAPNVLNMWLEQFNSIPQNILGYFLIDKQLIYIPTVLNKKEMVTVKVMVMDKYPSPYPSPYPRIRAIVEGLEGDKTKTDLDLDEIDKAINENRK